jgi:hypothetical protein
MTKMHAPARSALKRNTWCGPYAAAVVLTCSYDTAYDFMLKATRRRSITGMRTAELAKALREYGVDAQCIEMNGYWRYVTRPCELGSKTSYMAMKPLTLTQWVNERAKPGVTYIVAAGRHFMTVRDRKIICNQQPEWKSMAQRKGKGSYKRAQVTGVIEIAS